MADATFKAIDVDGNGKITLAELKAWCSKNGKSHSDSDLEALFKQADADNVSIG